VYRVGFLIHPENSVSSQRLSGDFQKTLFYAVVRAQDSGLSVEASREAVAAQWGVTIDQVKEVERAGIDEQWAPLG
jgi:hypothetical protein